MERYAIIIKTDGVCVLLHCYHGDCLSLEEMQKIVEGHIQAVPTALAQGWSQEPGVGLALIVNEEGKLQNLLCQILLQWWLYGEFLQVPQYDP